MCSSLDHKQEATNNFRSESSQGDHWHKGHKFPLHRNQSKSCGFSKQEESQNKIWTNVNFGGMDRNGFRTVRKHGQLGISQWLLKRHWRRLKVKKGPENRLWNLQLDWRKHQWRKDWKQRWISTLCHPLRNGWKEIFFASSNYGVAINICPESSKTKNPNWRAKGYRNQGSKNSMDQVNPED